MPLARTYDPSCKTVRSTILDAYHDRLSRDSDIREYLPFLHEQARGKTVIELGTRRGNSTIAFLAAGATVWSVDINNVIERYSGWDGMGAWQDHPNWKFIHGDDLDPKVIAHLPDKCDVLFVDTTHYYQETLDELRAYMPKVTGLALFHDTRLIPSPTEYKWDLDYPPVRKAIDDYCAETGLSWIEVEGKYGLGVIEVESRTEKTSLCRRI